MIRYLVRKCRYCGQVVKVQMEGSKIVRTEGARQSIIILRKSTKHTAVVLKKSDSTLICEGLRPERFDGRTCYRYLRVSSFQEVRV